MGVAPRATWHHALLYGPNNAATRRFEPLIEGSAASRNAALGRLSAHERRRLFKLRSNSRRSNRAAFQRAPSQGTEGTEKHPTLAHRMSPVLADFVAKVRDLERGTAAAAVFRTAGRLGGVALCHQAAPRAIAGGGRLTILASRLRFCAIAASVNSNCAPLGPRRRNRSRRKMRLRWANSISTFLRSRRDRA